MAFSISCCISFVNYSYSTMRYCMDLYCSAEEIIEFWPILIPKAPYIFKYRLFRTVFASFGAIFIEALQIGHTFLFFTKGSAQSLHKI